MVVLSKIYTRTGDGGQTSLSDGSRVPKHALRIHVFGTVDETNATIGMARLHAGPEADAGLSRISNDLFDVGADLSNPDLMVSASKGHPPLRVTAHQVTRLEREIDAMNERLSPIRSFILPGGSALAAHLHLCRTICRRAERLAVELATVESVNPVAVRYLNRLSDWFFVAARIANEDGQNDVLWQPGLTRDA